MRTALVMSFGFVVGAMAGAFALGTARAGDGSGDLIRVQITNIGSSPLGFRWPNYDLPDPPASTMADRFAIEPGVSLYFHRARSGDRIDIEAKAVNVAEPRPVDAKELSGVKSLLAGWEKNAAVQRRDNSCVATGFEYLLRSAGAEGIDYARFQDEFDLGIALNDYPTVAGAIERRYPDVRFAWSHFRSSEESMQFIERSIDAGRPIVLGLRWSPAATHIVPVIGYDDKWVYFLNYAHADGTKDVRAIRRWELARRDQEWTPATCQTAWLEPEWPMNADMKEAVKRDAAKSERRADPAAEELFGRYASLVHHPATAGWKSVTGKGESGMGWTWGTDPRWTPDTGFEMDFTWPQSLKDRWRQGQTEEPLARIHREILRAYGAYAPFELPAKNREHFHVTLRQDGDDQVVEMTPFDDKADAKSRRYVFGKDGLLKHSSIESKPGPNWPEGWRRDADWHFEKQGERYVIASLEFSSSSRGERYGSKFSYYDGPDGGALLKEITFWDRGEGARPFDVRFHDYVVDGKLVETTKAPPDGAGKPAETPPVPKDE